MKRALPLWIVLGLTALTLRAWNLDAVGLNTDEVYVARTSVLEPDWRFDRDIHPPAFPLLTAAFGAAADAGIEWRTRGVSVLAGTALVGVLAGVGYAVAGWPGALAAVIVAAFDPTGIAHARLARAYALSAYLQAMGFILFWEVVTHPTCRKRRYSLALVNALALYTFYYAAYFIAAQVAIAAVSWRRSRPVARSILTADAASLVAFAPWVAAAWRQAARFSSGGGWTDWTGGPYQWARRAVLTLARVSPADGLVRDAYGFSATAGAVVAVVAVGLMLGLAWRNARRAGADMGGLALQDAGGGMGFGLPFAVIAVVFSLAMAAHAILGAPIGYAYFSGLAAPATALFVQALFPPAMRNDVSGAASAWTSRAGAAAIGVIVAAQLAALPGALAESREDVREAVRAVDRDARPDAAVVCVAHFVKDAFRVYSPRTDRAIALPADLPGFGPIPREAPGVTPPEAEGALRAMLAGRSDVWLVESHGTRGGEDRGGAMTRRVLLQGGYTVLDRFDLTGVRVERYVDPRTFFGRR